MASEQQISVFSGWPEEASDIADEASSYYEHVGKLGEGKTGIAYKVRDKASGMHFCLKTIKHSVAKESRESVRETLAKEVAILEKLEHAAIPKVFRHDLEGECPYYVCTYHPGETFGAFQSSHKKLTRDRAIYVVQLLIDAFSHLHSVGRSHCDVHHKNVLVHPDVYAHGVMLIDFGSGHRESDSSAETQERGDYRHKPVETQGRSRNTVDRRFATTGFQKSDFKALGQLLALMSESFFGAAPNDQRMAYNEYCGMLQSGHITDWHSARTRFDSVLDPDYLISPASRLFLTREGNRDHVRLPVSGNVPIGEAITDVINTDAFQRLRGIDQLSFCSWVYPGGKHSRFEHSLGVMDATIHALKSLVRRPDFKDLHNAINVEGAILAALVHDVGHYPFAHVLEHYVAGRFPGEPEAKEIVSHSSHTLKLLEDSTELSDAIDKRWSDGARLEAVRILEGNVPILSQLLDGPIDCDKLDYIQRDAYHCGVSAGSGIDATTIAASYCVLDGGSRLGVEEKAVSAIEGFMVAQDFMLGQVYWHETIRSIMAMFMAVIASVVRRDKQKLQELVQDLKLCSSEHEAIDKVLAPAIASLGDERANALLPLFDLHVRPRSKSIYLPVMAYTAYDTPPNRRGARTSIYNAILPPATTAASTIPIDWEQVKRLRECFVLSLEEKLRGEEIDDFELLVDVPWGKGKSEELLVRSESGSSRKFSEASHLKDSIFEEITVYQAPVRVYFAPRLLAKVEEQVGSIVSSAEERFYSLAEG